MALKLAINGFGRIGRCILRALIETDRKDIEIIAINDLGAIDMNAHLLRYDCNHGRLGAEVLINGCDMTVGDRSIRVTSIRNPEELPWQDVDVVLECTGVFTDAEAAQRHLNNGSGRVLVSAPSMGADKTIVYGVNHQTLTPNDRIVSNASCTTNCLAPVAKVLHENFGIETGFMTTIHSYTGDQPTLDAMHNDPYRARAAALNSIPTSTGAARAVGLVLPELAGRLDGTAIRVPTSNVSAVDLCFIPSQKLSVDDVNLAVQQAANEALSGILDVVDAPLVSSDFNHDPRSSIFALDQTRVTDGNMVRILSWYDNEWGFSCRMLDTAMAMA